MVSVLVIGGFCGCSGFAFAFMCRVFFGDETVLVSFSEDKIKILQNRNIISETFFKFSLMHYEFMARLFPQQRPLIHFWTDVKKSVGQKWIYFGLAHQVVQEFRYRRFRVINRTLYTYFSICFYLCLITLEWIWNKSPGNRDICLSLRNLIKHAIYFKRHL